MTVRTRFAPSPTGRLHLGHAYAAWVAWELARRADGEFLLRHEDIDRTRVRPEFYDGIEEDLRWIGLLWRGRPIRQTDRASAYAAALESLKQQEAVYPCFCSRREIQLEISRMAGAPQGPESPIYPGTCRRLASAIRKERLESGIPYSWRLDALEAVSRVGRPVFTDLHRGDTTADPNLLGDVVLARKDIGIAYHLAVVVDDAFQNITQVTRGEDLLPSTHVHRLLQALLGLPVPCYFHHPLILDPSGRRLAKRDDDVSIGSLREMGMAPRAVLERAIRGMPPPPSLKSGNERP